MQGIIKQAITVRNPKIAEQMKVAYNWAPSTVNKADPNPESISSLKLEHRVPRAVIRARFKGEK